MKVIKSAVTLPMHVLCSFIPVLRDTAPSVCYVDDRQCESVQARHSHAAPDMKVECLRYSRWLNLKESIFQK